LDGTMGFKLSQYLSEENLQTWLDDKKNMFDSIMDYVKIKHKNFFRRMAYHY